MVSVAKTGQTLLEADGAHDDIAERDNDCCRDDRGEDTDLVEVARVEVSADGRNRSDIARASRRGTTMTTSVPLSELVFLVDAVR